MSLQTSINVQVILSAATPSGPSFGGALIAAYHTIGGSARVLGPYASSAAIVTAGFSATSPTVLAANKYFAQTPTPTAVYIGRRALPFTQKMKFTPLSTTNGDVYLLNFGAVAGVGGTLVTYTVSGSPTLATVCTALASAIQTAIGVGTATGASGTFVEWTAATAGLLVECQNQTPLLCDFLESTADPGIATDLTAIYNANPSAWYGLILDSYSSLEVQAAAAWVESNAKLFPANSADTHIGSLSTTADEAASPKSVAQVVKDAAYTRTGIQFVQNSNMSYEAAGLLGRMLPTTPGSATWAYKTLASVTADGALPPGWDTNAFAKNASVYTPLAGVNATQYCTTGSGSYLDTTLFIDWLKSTMQIALLTLFLNNPKIPYDATGFAMIASTMQSVLAQGERAGGLVPGSSVVSIPDKTTISSANISARNLPGVTFTSILTGAAHTISIIGTLTTS